MSDTSNILLQPQISNCCLYSFSAYLDMKGPSMLSSRWVSIVVDNEIKLCKNMFPAFFLRVQLRPASASDCRYVLSDALYTSLQGFNQVIIR